MRYDIKVGGTHGPKKNLEAKFDIPYFSFFKGPIYIEQLIHTKIYFIKNTV